MSLAPGGVVLCALCVGGAVAFSVALVYRFLDVIFRTVLGMIVLFARYRGLFGEAPSEAVKQPKPARTHSVVGD